MLVSWALTRCFSQRRRLSWTCQQTEIPRLPANGRFALLHEGRPVGTVSVARLEVINAGNRVLRGRSDLRGGALAVKAPPECHLLAAAPDGPAPEGIGATITDLDASRALVTFDALDHGERLVVTVVHDGSPDDFPVVTGQLLGGSIVDVPADGLGWQLLSYLAVALGVVVGALIGYYLVHEVTVGRPEDAALVVMATLCGVAFTLALAVLAHAILLILRRRVR